MAHACIAEHPAVYRLRDYFAMLADDSRVAAYAKAIAAQVKPGDRVIELGAGFGFFSILAARAGAAIVDAVDLNPVVHLGPRIAAANGCADRVRFHQADLLTFEPDARADVIVGDLRGVTPFAERSLEVLIRARAQMLREGGALIPRKDVLHVAPARHPAAFRRTIALPISTGEVNLSPAADILFDTPFRCSVAADDLLAPAASWGELDYVRLATSSHAGTAQWRCVESLHVEGLVIWFEADLGAGACLSSGPGGSATYGQLYLPLRTPLNVAAGGDLRVELAARYSAGDYVWTWTVQVVGADGNMRTHCVQNSLAERIIDPGGLQIVGL